jgi:ribosome-binding factor A
MGEGSRMRRVDEAVRAVLSDAITLGLKDPRVGFVTVTAVKTSPDLRHATVYVSVLGSDEERDDSLVGLRSAHGYLQRRVAAELRLKHTPTLDFAFDDSVQRGMRISEILAKEVDYERPEAESRHQGAGPDAPAEELS